MSETSQSDRRSVRLRRAGIVILGVAVTVSVLMTLLLAAAWRNDRLIESDMAATSGEVLSAGRLRSAVTYVTPEGVQNPEVGILYPTNLTAGQRINVEYSRSHPDLVRVAGRDASVAIVPTLSVVVAVWLLALPAILWLYRNRRKNI